MTIHNAEFEMIPRKNLVKISMIIIKTESLEKDSKKKEIHKLVN